MYVVLTFMSVFYKHVFPELEQLRLVMRYIEQRCDRSGHAHREGHFGFTEIKEVTELLKRKKCYKYAKLHNYCTINIK